MSPREITMLIRRLEEDDDTNAMEGLWAEYFEQLTKFARRRLSGSAAVDEEDVALSAMHSFYRATQEKRSQWVQDRHDLWKLLVTIASRKIQRNHQRANAIKRGGRNGAGSTQPTQSVIPVEELADPSFLDELTRQFDELISVLPGEKMQQIGTDMLQGCKLQEIADRRGISRATVVRKLKRIRNIWQEALKED